MRIAFLISRLLVGGIDTSLLRYLTSVGQFGVEPVLVVRERYAHSEVYAPKVREVAEMRYVVSSSFLTSLCEKKRQRKLNVFETLAEEAILRPLRRLTTRLCLRKSIADCDVVVDFDSTSYSFLGKVNKPKIAFFHFSVNSYHRGNEKKLARLGRSLDSYDSVVCVSNAMMAEAQQRYPHLAPKLKTIFNPIDVTELQTLSRAYTPVVSGDFIVSVCRLDESQKDVASLLRAYKEVQRSSDRSFMPLVIIGNGPDEAKLKAQVAALKLDAKVRFLGFLDNPMPYIARAKAFVLSTKFEGLPTVLLEAQSLGTPVIASDAPTGPREILEDGKAGVLVPVGDNDALADAIIRVTSDDDLRNSLVIGGLASAERFSAENVVRQFVDLCNSLLSKPSND